MSSRCVRAKSVLSSDAPVVQHPEVALTVGKGIAGIVQRRNRVRRGRLCPFDQACQRTVFLQRPQCLMAVCPREASVFSYPPTLPVAQVLVPGALLFLVRQVAKAVSLCIKQVIEPTFHPAEDVAVAAQSDVTDAVGRHVAAVAHLRLEGLKGIAVEAAQSVPGTEPHKALPILQHLRDTVRGHSVLLVVLHDVAQRLCLQRQKRQYCDQQHRRS